MADFSSSPDRSAPRIDHGGRVPPQAVEVEQSVLGAMLLERDAIPKVIEVLPDEPFYSQKHNRIYGVIQELFGRGNPIDLITVSDELKRREQLEEIGGSYYLTELTARVASAANVEYHARIIAEKSLLRSLIEQMSGLIGEAYDPSADAFELLDAAETSIFQISDKQLRKAATSMNDVLKETMERLESIHGRTDGVTGVPTGFPGLDALTGGWQPSDLIIIAARPSMGKTAFSLACARNAALKADTGVAIFSLEMSSQQLAQRMLTSEARVDAQKARTGRLSDRDWPRLAQAAGKLSAAKIFIDDSPGLNVLELRAKCRRLCSDAENNVGLVIVDYLQLMHSTSMSRNSNREQEIAHISRSLKGLAKELNIPVVALSQLSRAVETRGGDKRPQLSDLRESGSIEQDADVVAFLYRPEYYGITVDDAGNSTEGIGEIIVGKQRNGPLGNVRLAFVKQHARFENLTTYYAPPGGDLDPGASGGDGFGSPADDAPF